MPDKQDTQLVVATTAYGDILYRDNKLVIPATEYIRYEYNYVTQQWYKIENCVVKISKHPPTIKLDDLFVKDNEFFDTIVMNDRKSTMQRVYRHMRENVCYLVVNRGRLWYDHLTLAQQTELNDWYEQWLDITETFNAPETPEWVNEKIKKIDVEELL